MRKPDVRAQAGKSGIGVGLVPLGVPWLQPAQVAPVAVFPASDAAAMVTGSCHDVNGSDSAHVTA